MVLKKNILVTGSPRSGTTWVGHILGQASSVRYVHEPFNISANPCHCGVNFRYWFQYLSPETCHEFAKHLQHTIYPAYTWVGLLNTVTEVVQSKRIRPLSRYFQSYLSHRVVVKDPIAVFSAERLAQLFDMNVVVLVRHPAAIVSSYKELNWTHSFSHFMNQAELMEEHLEPFRPEIEDFVKYEHDIVDQAALLWKLIHYMLIKYQKRHSDWIFVRHEDLALNPIEGYQDLFNRLELPFSEHIRGVIQANSLQKQLTDTTRPYNIKRNSSKVNTRWKKYLTSEEITKIRKRVEDVSSYFFSHDEWYIFLVALLFI